MPAVLLALLLLWMGMGASSASAYVPAVATAPGNIGAVAGVVESYGSVDIGSTASGPGVPDRVTDPRIGEWFDHAGDHPISGGQTSEALWAEMQTLESRVGMVPKLINFGRFALGGVAGFAALTVGEYLLGKLLAPEKPTSGQIWWMQLVGALSPGDQIDGRQFTGNACENSGSGQTVFGTPCTYVAPAAVQYLAPDAGSNPSYYYCSGGSGPQTPEAATGPTPAGFVVTILGSEPTVNAGTCGSGSWVHFALIRPMAASQLGPPVPTCDCGTQLGSQSASNPSPPSASALQTSITNELNTGNYPTLSQWFDHEADPGTYPDPTVTTFTVPQPQAHETYPHYLDRLRAAGALGTVTQLDLDPRLIDTTRGPNEVARTSPAGDTVVDVGVTVRVYTNPDSAPEPVTSTAAETVDPPSTPTTPAVDFGPLNAISLGDKFPFAVPGWVAGALGGFGGPDTCPGTPVLHGPGQFANDSLPVPLCELQPALDVVRPVLLFGSLLGLAWMFAGAALGFGGSGATEEE